jgi:predicted dehydrogenase
MADDMNRDIAGFDETDPGRMQDAPWEPVSDRVIRIGIAGHGFCKFGAAFGFQDHPSVEVVAVTDVDPERCAALAKSTRCKTTYASLEEMLRDDRVEAVMIATDAPSHCRHCVLALEHGKHVACAVPAVWGSLEDADNLYAAVKRSGLKYMMFETSAYHSDCFLMRETYRAGLLGRIIYSEGHYYHYAPEPLGSHNNWREGSPPMWYATHSTAYYIAVTGGHYTEVACLGFRGNISTFRPEGNAYGNPFDSETALFKTDQGGASRMNCCWGAAGSHGDFGLVHGELGAVIGTEFSPKEKLGDASRFWKPRLPEGVDPGGHGGSHGYLTNEFITAILEDRDPLINVAWSLNMTVPGIIAHQSALKDGEWLAVPHYDL